MVLALLRRVWRAVADFFSGLDLGNLAWTPSMGGKRATRRPPGTLMMSKSGRHYKRVGD